MIKIIGHRGASGYAPENTLLSFQKAIEFGCDAIELDVRLSKDDKLVVIHDRRVDRTTNGKGSVSKMTLAEIKLLDCDKNQKVPILQEVIDICDINLQIELKVEGTPFPVYNTIIKNNILSRTLVISFDAGLLEEIKNLDPNIKTGFLFRRRTRKAWKGYNSICPESSIVNKEMVDKAHGLGMEVYVYNVDDKALAEYLIDWGVDGIGTDYPDLLK